MFPSLPFSVSYFHFSQFSIPDTIDHSHFLTFLMLNIFKCFLPDATQINQSSGNQSINLFLSFVPPDFLNSIQFYCLSVLVCHRDTDRQMCVHIRSYDECISQSPMKCVCLCRQKPEIIAVHDAFDK